MCAEHDRYRCRGEIRLGRPHRRSIVRVWYRNGASILKWMAQLWTHDGNGKKENLMHQKAARLPCLWVSSGVHGNLNPPLLQTPPTPIAASRHGGSCVHMIQVTTHSF